MIVTLGLGLACALACVGLWPQVVNGDGLGYLKAQAALQLYPGHLGYVPLLAGLRALFHLGPRPVSTLLAARILSAVSAAIAVIALGRATALLVDDREADAPAIDPPNARARTPAAWVAAAGLGASFGTLGAGSDVETYAPALAALCLTLYFVARRRSGGGFGATLGAAIALALAGLLHLENVLFVLPAALALPRRDRPSLVAIAGALGAAAYALPLTHHGLGWLAGASHGFRHPLKLATPAIALYGACKALVYAPYPYEASWLKVLGAFSLGLAALAALAGILCARDRERKTRLPLGGAATATWALSYSAVGVAFFASDAERWIFLLPLLWLTVATAPRFRLRALAIAALLVVTNFALWLPRARDGSWRVLARQAARHAHAGDLVISPGHSWDEYLGFYDGPAIDSFPLAYYAAALGGAAPLKAALAARIRGARARGAEVLLVRVDDARDPLGWKELRPFGITPENVATLLPPGPRVPLGDEVARLEP